MRERVVSCQSTVHAACAPIGPHEPCSLIGHPLGNVTFVDAAGADSYGEQQGSRFSSSSRGGSRGGSGQGDPSEGEDGDLVDVWEQLSHFLKGQCAGTR